MTAHAEPLVGRVDELGELDRALAKLRDGRPAAFELAGDPGIGKSRLLAEVVSRANGLGYLVFGAAGSELERDVPFAMFVDALDEFLQGLDPRRIDALAESARALGLVFPSLALPDQDAFRQHERYHSHRAFRELLERLTGRGPLVLALDDMHWADPASVDLFASLLRRPPDAAVLLVVADRPRQRSERLGAELAAARASGALVTLELEALTREEASQLLGISLQARRLGSLYDESGGNPFYLGQLARSARDAARDAQQAGGNAAEGQMPPVVEAALAEELTRPSEPARLFMRGAAVAGDPFDADLAAATAGVKERAALAAVDELLRLDLIRTTAAPRRFGFRHPLVRRAVYDTTPAGWLVGAHERAARSLAASGSTVVARAHHVERSASQGDAQAIATLRVAGTETALHAPASAASWFAAALRLLPDHADAGTRMDLLLARSGALASCGRFVDAHADLLASLELAPADAIDLRVPITTACAGVEHLLGRHEQSHARLLGALQTDGAAEPRAEAALMIELALDGIYRMRYAQTETWAARALDAAQRLDDPLLVAAAASVMAWGAGLSGRPEVGERHRAVAATLIDGLSDRELAGRLGACVNLAGAELYLDRFDDTGRHAERAIGVARDTGQLAVVPFAFMLLAWVRMLTGQLTAGGEMLEDAVEEARLLGNDHSLAGLLLNQSLTALLAGDLGLAVRAAEEGVELTRDADAGLVPAASTLAYAGALLETGDARLADAVDLMLLRCGGRQLPLMPGGSFRAKWLELLTRCWIALGRIPDAELAAADARATATSMGSLPLANAMADRAAAHVALARGDARTASHQAQASATYSDSVGAAMESAISRRLAGRALAQEGRKDEALAELERAAESFQAFGARTSLDAVHHELRLLGRHVHRRGNRGDRNGVGVETLTDREHEVALLVFDRRTNAQIAETLFLSPKTVETHLRNIFRKLGVGSRVEVARALEAAKAIAAT
jgi:DNA-binding CsgD family transcriptional regulator